MLLQCRFSYKLSASSMPVLVDRSGILCAHRVALAVLRGGQQPLPLKVAPIQPCVTAAFHLQSRRDSDCQMWELHSPLKFVQQLFSCKLQRKWQSFALLAVCKRNPLVIGFSSQRASDAKGVSMSWCGHILAQHCAEKLELDIMSNFWSWV